MVNLQMFGGSGIRNARFGQLTRNANPDTRVWAQEREVIIEDIAFTDHDMGIRISNPRSDPMSYEVNIYNPADAAIDAISTDSMVEISLGWESGPTEQLVNGFIEELLVTYEQTNRVLQIEGEDETNDRFREEIAGSWRNEEPSTIAGDIASRVGLSAITEPTNRVIPGMYSITTERTVEEWLDELLEYASFYTGVEWEMFGQQGQLFFVPSNYTEGNAPRLTYDSNLLSINEVDDEDNPDIVLTVETLLDPRIRKGREIRIDTDRFTGMYRVASVEHNSDSTGGTHVTSARLVRADVQQVNQEYRQALQHDIPTGPGGNL